MRFMFTAANVFAAAVLAVVAGACAQPENDAAAEPAPRNPSETYSASAVFAGGCFWCVEADLEKLDGVGDVIAGYAGGESDNPTYRDHEGHLEVVRAPFDPDVISYRELTDFFLRHIDPFDDGGQFCDRGRSYTTAIFYDGQEQKEAASAAVAAAEAELGREIVTPVMPLDAFYIAEDYHQDYYKKNPVRYNFYRSGCRRDARVDEVWGEKS